MSIAYKFNPKLGRHFLLHDPLQLSKDVDGSWRTPAKFTFLVNLFRQRGYRIYWSLFKYHNMMIAYGKNDLLKDFIKNFCNGVKNSDFKQSVEVGLYDFNGDFKNLGYEEDEEFLFFIYHPYEESLSHFIDQVKSHRNFLRALAREKRLVEFPNKKLQFLFVLLDDVLVNEINRDDKVFEDFKNIILHSDDERIYVVPLIRDVSKIRRDFVAMFDFVAFLGDTNMDTAKNVFYPGAHLTTYNYSQIIIGLVHLAIHPNLLFIAHPLKRTLSEAYIKTKNSLEQEKKDYIRYLEMLKKDRNNNGNS